jgi:hypothetical protein
MGSMSASDAAPLPRLGEVFFDVRGESRTMRLSWYADTGVAVFSIWQGGTCTGTFRLPIPDLPRMVEALQRGPHAQDDLVTGERPASREHRPPTVPGQRGPARSSRPELLDGDIATGQSTAAVHAPPTGPDVTGYQAGPPLPGHPAEPPLPGYAAEPPLAGHPAEPPGGYSGGPLADGPGYPAGLAEPAQEFTGYAAEPAPDFAAEPGPRHRGRERAREPGGYAGEPLAPDRPRDPSTRQSGPPTERRSGGRRARRAAGYPDEDPQGYPGGPGAAGYGSEPAGGYLDEHGGAGYGSEPAAGYVDDETLLAPGYPEDHQDGPLGAEPGVLGDDPLTADYPAGYGQEDRGDRYPADPGGRPRQGRRGREPANVATGDYADGPPPGGYPDEQDDYQRYAEEPPATEYGSPARPYVTDAGDTDEPFAEEPPERRRPRGRRRAEPSPESFPYGPPPTDDEPRQRGRYPGRH